MIFSRFFVRSLLLLGIGLLSACGSPDQRAQSAYDRGAKLMEQGDLVKASLEFRNALKAKQGFVPALYSLGTIAEKQGRLPEALKLYMDVAERATDNVDARVHLGFILAGAGQLDKAEQYVAEAEKLTSSNAELLATKATIALQQRKLGEAVQLANQSLNVDPQNVHALIVLGAERLIASDAKAALDFLDRGAKVNDRDVGLQALRIRAFQLLKDKDNTEATLLKLAGYYPKDQSFAIVLVRFYIAAGRKDDAEKALRTFAEANPDNTNAELTVVQFLARTKGLDAARGELQAKIDKGGKVVPYREALADLWLADSKYDTAVDTMRKLITDTGDTPDGYSAKVHLARMVGKKDPAEAGKLVDSVIAGDAKNVDALVVRASLRTMAGKVPDAIEDLRAALNQQPQSALILQLLAEAYERNGAVSLAEEQLVKAYTIQPGPDTGLNYVRFLLRYGKPDPAERVLTDLRAKAPANRAVLTELAQVKLAKRDWAGAQEVSDALRKLGDKQDQGTADQIVAATLTGEGKFDESLKVLQSGSATEQAAALPEIVRNYVGAGKADQAENLLKSTLAAKPDNIQAQLLLGSLYQVDKRSEDAEAAFKTAVRADPKNPAPYGALADFYQKSGRLADAEKTVRDGLAQTSDNRNLQLVLAAILDVSGQHDAAIAQYEKLFEADPRSTIVANNLASLLSEYRTDQASIDRAFAIATRFKDSGVPQYLDTLGWTYYLKGQYSDALNELKFAADKLPQAASVQYHLGMAYKELGQKDLAVTKLKAALAIIPPPAEPEAAKARAALEQLATAAPPDQPKAPDQSKAATAQ